MIAVSIYCITYNHEPYIRDALEGFVRQKTDFPFEAIVHDDASTDGTAEIVGEYARRYPDLIVPVLQEENQHSKGRSILRTQILPRARGRYLAACEGDDFWTDEYKLQKQYDYMESHPGCTFCFTNAVIRNEADGRERTFIPYSRTDAARFDPGRGDYGLHDFYRLTFIPMASFFYRRECLESLSGDVARMCPSGDLRLRLYAASLGYAHFLNEKTCVYRENVPGSQMASWKRMTRAGMYRKALLDTNMLMDLDERTGRAFHDGLARFMAVQGAPLLEQSSVFGILSDPDRREIFRAMTARRKAATLLRALLPHRIEKGPVRIPRGGDKT